MIINIKSIPEGRSVIAQDVDDVMIVVAGGAGKHSAYCPSFALNTRSVTKEVPVRA